jgi:uncharacterized protein (TIGR02453 family)
MESIFEFLKDLQSNNNREWFQSNKNRYETNKTKFIEIVDGIIKGLATFDPMAAELSAKSCIYRINRDVRFSSDKSPYKSNFGATINPFGKKSPKAGYYIQIQPETCFWAAGIYQPMPDVLKKVRQEIDYNFEEFKSILEDPKFKSQYSEIFKEGKLSRHPKDYSIDNPAIEYLKLKHYIFANDFKDNQYKTTEELINNCVNGFKTLKPFVDFINRAFDDN